MQDATKKDIVKFTPTQKVNQRIGKCFNHWTILEYIGHDENHRAYYKMQCVCGTVKIKHWEGKNITNSCGCQINRKELGKKSRQGRWGIVLEKGIYKRIQRDAKVRKKDFNISFHEFSNLVHNNCFYCNKPPSQIYTYKNRICFKYNGLDRVDNTKGYVSGNCVPCCGHCNTLKKAITPEMIVKAYNFLFGEKNGIR